MALSFPGRGTEDLNCQMPASRRKRLGYGVRVHGRKASVASQLRGEAEGDAEVVVRSRGLVNQRHADLQVHFQVVADGGTATKTAAKHGDGFSPRAGIEQVALAVVEKTVEPGE